MAFDLKQSQRLTQQLLMTPQLQQAIKLLQLSRLELEQFIDAQLAENPVLEEGPTESIEESIQAEKEQESTEEQFISERMGEASHLVDMVSSDDGREMDWESFVPREEIDYQASKSKSGDREDLPNYENIITRTDTLAELLLKQASEVDLDEKESERVASLIGNIDDKGYLATSLQEFAEKEKITFEEAEDLLDVIQQFDPAGVGARDLSECLMIQIKRKRLRNPHLEAIVKSHLIDLEVRNYQAIAKALKISQEEVIEQIAVLTDLEPIPGRPFGGDIAPIVIPDVYVFKMGHEWVVSMNDDTLPRLRLSGTYQSMLKNKEMKGTEREYLQEKQKSAQWLIKSLQQRQSTIFKVAEKIVEKQRDFFELGPEHLRPMILRDIAEAIEVHESTISRVTTHKYMHTPRGVFELKYFFNSAISTSDGDGVASESVKRMIATLVKEEDAKSPLSDQEIADKLSQRGINLARRTVAKYREQLNILPSSRRKRTF